MSGFMRRNGVRSVFIMVGIVGLSVLLYVRGHATAQQCVIKPSANPDYIFPGLPSNLPFVGSPAGVPLLRKSKNLSGIVAWAEQNFGYGTQFHSVVSPRRGATCFIVIYDTGSGVHVFHHVLYAQRMDIADGWEAVATGPVGASEHWDYVRSVYFNEKRRELVFGGQDGQAIRHIPLASAWWTKWVK